MADAKTLTVPKGATGVLVFADGSAVFGRGFGAVGDQTCFPLPLGETATNPNFPKP